MHSPYVELLSNENPLHFPVDREHNEEPDPPTATVRGGRGGGQTHAGRRQTPGKNFHRSPITLSSRSMLYKGHLTMQWPYGNMLGGKI